MRKDQVKELKITLLRAHHKDLTRLRSLLVDQVRRIEIDLEVVELQINKTILE